MKLLSRDEIAAGIRNALDRGYSLDEALQSFINAGYNVNEVEEAARLFNSSGMSILSGNNDSQKISQQQFKGSNFDSKPIQASQTQFQQNSNFVNQNQNFTQAKTKKSNKGLVIALVSVLILLLAGIILSIIFKSKLISFFSNLFS